VFVCPTVYLVHRQQQRRAAGLLLSALRAPRVSTSAAGARAQPDAGSVMQTAKEGGSTRT